MDFVETIKDNLERALEHMIVVGKQELRAQGHYSSGALEDSFDVVIREMGETIIGEIIGLDYGLDLNFGVPASKVNYSAEQLRGWAERLFPGKDNSEITSFIYATRNRHGREGIPTRSWAARGKRLGWIDDMVSKSQSQLEQILNLAETLEKSLLQLVRDFEGNVRTGSSAA